MIVISTNLALSLAADPGADNAVIGWHNIVTAGNIAADSSLTGFPASNMANPATFLKWKAAAFNSPPDSPPVDEHVTITTGSVDPIDYVAIAGHNLGSSATPVSIEGLISGNWEEIVQATVLPDDGPALFRFVPQSLSQVRLRLQDGTAPAQIAVVYCGRLLVMERGLYDNHTPISYARRVEVSNGRSERGQFLGRIVTGRSLASSARFTLLSPAWFRASMDPFLIAAQAQPFFFAWRPQTYPHEIGFAWLTNDPMPVNAPPSKLIEIELQMGGVATLSPP
jgi:hypothetical protein